MTWGEIKKQVQSLCFEGVKEDFEADYGAGLIDAANSCLKDLANTSARFHETLKTSIPKLNNLLNTRRGEIFVHSDTDLIFHADGNGKLAYTFDCDGNADVMVGTLKIDCKSTGQFKRYFGIIAIENGIDVVFGGVYAYRIRNVAVYGNLRSGLQRDIPEWSECVRLDMRRLAANAGGKEFMKFDNKLPVTNNGAPIGDFAYEGDDTILIPVKYDGEIGIPYTRLPCLLAPDAPDNAELDLDPAAQELMPYFIAARVYMDYDVQKSIIYMNLYEQRKQETFNELPVHSQWTSFYGW